MTIMNRLNSLNSQQLISTVTVDNGDGSFTITDTYQYTRITTVNPTAEIAALQVQLNNLQSSASISNTSGVMSK